MRTLPAVVLAVLVLSPAGAGAQEQIVRIKVGESKPGFGTVRPVCDAPSVAVIQAGVLRGVGPGETLCSAATFQAQGTRRVYRVVVTRPDEPEAPAGKGDAAPVRR